MIVYDKLLLLDPNVMTRCLSVLIIREKIWCWKLELMRHGRKYLDPCLCILILWWMEMTLFLFGRTLNCRLFWDQLLNYTNSSSKFIFNKLELIKMIYVVIRCWLKSKAGLIDFQLRKIIKNRINEGMLVADY